MRLIFYLFFWYLPQGGGFTGIGNFSSLFKSGLMEKFLELFLIVYNFIDINNARKIANEVLLRVRKKIGY